MMSPRETLVFILLGQLRMRATLTTLAASKPRYHFPTASTGPKRCRYLLPSRT